MKVARVSHRGFVHLEGKLEWTLLLGVALWTAAIPGPLAEAQQCSGTIQAGCTKPGAVCKPVTVGTGQTGHCETRLPKGERECDCVGASTAPPPPPVDAGCSNRSGTGKFTCTISQPNVKEHESEYPKIAFAPGDVVEINANGCVQTGGLGKTWKRYVNPWGPNSDKYYHGLVRIPTATETGGGLVRINTVIGTRLHVSGVGLPVDQLYLHLGYEDDKYSDNGYYRHDDGTEDQCKITDGDPVSGGPAYAVVTIYRGVAPDPPQSDFNFDVLSGTVDANGLPYNPSWSWQLRANNAGQVPSTSLCHKFSTRDSTVDIPNALMSPYFGDCTDQADSSTVDIAETGSLCWYRLGTTYYIGDTFAGHVNWFPVTVEGHADSLDHSGWPYPFGDDDYDFLFWSDLPGNPLGVTEYGSGSQHPLHVEFDSDETIDHFQETAPGSEDNEWKDLRNAEDNNGNVSQLFDGHAILTGMFGLDTEHDLKPELHPLFAMATRRDTYENSPSDEAWLIFVRNQGDEGYCSQLEWDLGLEDYTFHLPWRPGATSVSVNFDKTFFSGTDGTSGPTFAVLSPGPPISTADQNAGVYATFHLGPPIPKSYRTDASTPYIYGVLHLVWSQPEGGVAAASSALAVSPSRAGAAANAMEKNAMESDLESAAKRLTPAQQLQLKQASTVTEVEPAVHRLQLNRQVRVITQPPVPAKVGLHATQGGPETYKLQRRASQVHALCTATKNAPPGLPPDVCKTAASGH
jgi:hypothetical protein